MLNPCRHYIVQPLDKGDKHTLVYQEHVLTAQNTFGVLHNISYTTVKCIVSDLL